MKLIHGVQYVPTLAHNLLSVDQLLNNGYTIIFDGEVRCIKDKATGVQIACIQMTENKMFPLEVSTYVKLMWL